MGKYGYELIESQKWAAEYDKCRNRTQQREEEQIQKQKKYYTEYDEDIDNLEYYFADFDGLI